MTSSVLLSTLMVPSSTPLSYQKKQPFSDFLNLLFWFSWLLLIYNSKTLIIPEGDVGYRSRCRTSTRWCSRTKLHSNCWLDFPLLMDHLQLSDHVGQNLQTGKQMTHWDMLNKENSNLVALLNMSQCVICSPVSRFCPTWSLSCKWSISKGKSS